MAEQGVASAAEMEALGGRLAGAIRAPALVGLEGPLGAGKTTLVRGFLRALGHAGPVRSPSYTLLESYPLNTAEVHHLDLYRLVDPAELEDLGLRDLLGPRSICLIEWPERGQGVLPALDWWIRIDCDTAPERRVCGLPGPPARV